MFSLTISTPFYNEEEGIDYYIDTLKKILDIIPKSIKVSIIWINDGSADNTLKILNEKKKLFLSNEIKIISHKKNYGYGRTLINSIRQSNTDYFITYDSDCCYNYKIILELINNVINEKSDIVNVSYKLAKKKMKVSLFRNFLAISSIQIYKILFKNLRKHNLTYFNCSFRIYKLEIIKDIELQSDDFNACAEILVKSAEKNIKISEIAGENTGRNFGKSKMKIIQNIYHSLLTIFRMRLKLNSERKFINEYEIM